MEPKIIGVDVGGSHVTAAVVGEPATRVRSELSAGASELVDTVRTAVAQALGGSVPVAIVGLSMPGPFDYTRGRFTSRRGQKFGTLFGQDLRQALLGGLHDHGVRSIHFFNDARCFAWGDWCTAGSTADTLALTFGTGLGSAFIIDGGLRTSGHGVPAEGYLYHQPHRGSPADETFSTRGLVRRYHELTWQTAGDARELHIKAAAAEPAAMQTFANFADELATFLEPWLAATGIRRLRLGGNISLAGALITDPLHAALSALGSPTEIGIAPDPEIAAIHGAGWLAQASETRPAKPRRKSSQPELPVHLAESKSLSGYDLFPAWSLKSGAIHAGLDLLAERITQSGRTVVVDGFEGAFWDEFTAQLDHELRQRGIAPRWLSADVALRPVEDIEALVRPFLGEEQSIFGRRFTGRLADFFDPEKLSELRPIPGGVSILYGCGAALAGWEGPIIYLDVPKNELQFRQRAGCVDNLGATAPLPPGLAYKRSYFVDWIALNAHKRDLLSRLDAWVDGQRDEAYTWLSGDDLRSALRDLGRAPFRARPWFEPGVWGGDWLKQRIPGLSQDVPNYAWSFELITPENGILLLHHGCLAEISFDLLLFQDNRALLGRAAERFGVEFPLRFDFLDTWNGGNLSVQVHPKPDYIRDKFGENFTQDETYYILDAQPDAAVYLGLQAGIDPERVAETLQLSAQTATPWPVEQFVQKFPARRHDLFLIPHGTIHGAGRGCVVLEISSTPYIFTFKLYDWLRPGLDGLPRPLNLGHGLANLDFSLAGDIVPRTLISKHELIAVGPGWRRFRLPTHPRHFYEVERYEIESEVTISANGHCRILMIVEGETAHVVGANQPDKTCWLHFAETLVVPAAAGSFTVIPQRPGKPLILVVAHVRD